MGTALYTAVKLFFRTFYTVYNRLEIKGLENVPDEPAIVASNHASNIDPPLVGAAFPRPLRYLAKESLFKGVLGGMIRSLGAISVRREDASNAGAVLRILLDRLASGEDVLIFPEGSRSRDGRLHSLEGGAAFLSVKSGRPMVPAYIAGSFEVCPPGASVPRPHKLSITFCRPIYPDGRGTDRERREISLRALEASLSDMERAHMKG